jgi:hypothetical protein
VRRVRDDARPRRGQDLDLTPQPIAEPVLLDLKVMVNLKVEPEPLGGPEVSGKAQGGIGGDRPRPVDDLEDPPRGDSRLLGEPIRADRKRDQGFLEEDLAGMDRGLLSVRHRVNP